MELLLEVNGIDIVILVVFFGSILIGTMRGFTKELLSLFSWGGALSLSYAFLPMAQGLIQQYIANPIMAGGIGLFCLFVISLIMLSIVTSMIAGYIHESSFRGIDYSLGFGFGILRGVIFISAIELTFSVFWPRQTQPPAIQTARFIPMVRKGGDIILQILPASAQSWLLEQAVKAENQAKAKLRDSIISDEMQEKMPENAFKGKIPIEDLTHHGKKPSTASSFSPTQQPTRQGSQSYHPIPQVMTSPQQANQIPSQMVVIRPPQPGQTPQLAPASRVPSVENPPKEITSPPPVGLTQSEAPQNKQSTVDALSRLKPRSSKEERGYTRGQRDDMNRLLQAADGG